MLYRLSMPCHLKFILKTKYPEGLLSTFRIIIKDYKYSFQKYARIHICTRTQTLLMIFPACYDRKGNWKKKKGPSN